MVTVWQHIVLNFAACSEEKEVPDEEVFIAKHLPY